jgi:hypothetical protein
VTLRGYSIHLLCDGHLVLSSPAATAPHQQLRRRAVVLVQLAQASGRCGSGLLEGVEKRFCSFQIGRLEPFRELVVDRLEKRHGLGGTALIAE